MVMMVAMGTTVFAQTEGTAAEGKGSITIENAAKGETYGVVKLFDATLTNDATATTDATGIAYKGDIPTALAAYFTKDEAGNIHIATHGDPAVAWTDAEITTAVQNWAKDQAPSATAVSDGSALTFQGLDYGYYAVQTSQGAVITIDSTKPTATVRDKNTKTPSATKEVNPAKGSVGDTVTYTATFDAPNYLENTTTNPSKSEQVVSYVIQDTLPNFLSDVAITSVKVVETPAKEAQGTEGEDGYVPATAEVSTDLSASYTAFDANKKIEIPWVVETVPTSDHKYTSKYKNGSQIVITYTAKITSNAAIGAGNINKVSLFPQVDRGNGKEPFQETDEWNDTASITTHAAALQKKAVSATGDNLAGAEFKFKGLTVIGEAGKYTVVSYDPNGAADSGTVMQCDSDGKLVIGGIDSGVTLVGTETKAPDGYNKLEGTFNLPTIEMATTTTTTWGSKTTYYDEDGNVVDEEVDGGSSTTTATYNEINTIPASSIQNVVNNKGTELPSTGGIGTTIFYVIGAILVLGAGILLVTRRRMNAN